MPVADEGSDLREVRQDYLREWYGFQCACAECTLQVQDYTSGSGTASSVPVPSVRFRYRELIGEWYFLLTSTSGNRTIIHCGSGTASSVPALNVLPGYL